LNTPSTPPKRTRVVICRGQYCNIGRRAEHFYARLKERIDEINGDQQPPPIKLETANCMSMCGMGPNLVIYPQAMLFSELDDAMIEQVIDDYLDQLKAEGKPENP
jgi:(2Fe-2S) ferredoxin